VPTTLFNPARSLSLQDANPWDVRSKDYKQYTETSLELGENILKAL